jgi:hypothetical protein
MNAPMNKIKKLLAMANDPGASEQERETATRQAASLMAKHEIDEYDLMIAEGREWDLIEMECRGTRPGKKNAVKVPPWINVLGFGVKLFCGVRCTILPGGRMVFKGTRTQVELATWMHDALVNACYSGSKGRSDPSAWRNGYASAIQARLRDMRKAADSDTPGGSGTALVLVQGRLEMAMNEKWGIPGKSVSLNVRRGSEGYSAGQSAHIPTHRPMQDSTVKGYLS